MSGVLAEVDDGCAWDFDSGVLALVVFPEFVAAVGFVVVPATFVASLDSFAFALFDFDLLVSVPLVSGAVVVSALGDAAPVSVSVFDFFLLAAVVFFSATGVSPFGGVALAAGSATALFFDLLLVAGVALALSPAVVCPVSVLFFFDLLVLEEVAAAPDALVELSVPSALPAPVFFFVVFVFLEVVDASPEAACGAVVVSVDSPAGFFFFFVLFVAVESVCAWSEDCRAARPYAKSAVASQAIKRATHIVK